MKYKISYHIRCKCCGSIQYHQMSDFEAESDSDAAEVLRKILKENDGSKGLFYDLRNFWRIDKADELGILKSTDLNLDNFSPRKDI